MGRVNVLVEGVSCAGKTSVAEELERRGHQVVHGDRQLAHRGDPVTGTPVEAGGHEHHLWRVDRVRELVADRSAPVTFFCGGSRNWPAFVDLFDAVVVLQLDRATLERRLSRRPSGEWGSAPHEREQVLRLHATGEDVPPGVAVDATAALEAVVDEVLAVAGLGRARSARSTSQRQVGATTSVPRQSSSPPRKRGAVTSSLLIRSSASA